MGLASASVFAHDNDNEYIEQQQAMYRPAHNNGVGYQVNHLNRMLNHVRGEFSRYGAGWRVRRELGHISAEVNHVNSEYRQGDYGSGHIRSEIEHIHAELHDVEVRLHVRAGDYYRWQ